jgi:hypothetical protein
MIFIFDIKLKFILISLLFKFFCLKKWLVSDLFFESVYGFKVVLV